MSSASKSENTSVTSETQKIDEMSDKTASMYPSTSSAPPGLAELIGANDALRRVGSLESLDPGHSTSGDESGTGAQISDIYTRNNKNTKSVGQIICDRAFNLFDKDQTGKISMEELKLLVSSLGKRMNEDQLNTFVKEHRPKRVRRGSTGGMFFHGRNSIGMKVVPSDSILESDNSAGSSTGTHGSRLSDTSTTLQQSSNVEPLERTDSSVSVSSTVSKFLAPITAKAPRKSLLVGLTDSKQNNMHIRREEFEHIIGKFRTVGAVDSKSDSDNDVDDADKDAIASMHWWICLHDATWRVSWDLAILATLIYVMIVTPYRIGFDNPAKGFFFIFELIIDFFFIVDIPIQFCTSYVNSQGVRETRWYMIARNYLTGYFTIDFVSSVPWDLLLQDDDGSSSTTNSAASSTRVMKTLRLFKLMKLGRMARVKKFITTFNEYIKISREALNVFAAIAMLCLCAHFMACLWAFGGRYGIPEDNFAVDSWQAKVGVVDADVLDEYITALYWAVTSVTTVGYGDIIPSSRAEYVIAIIAMSVGVSFYGYLTAVLTAFFLHQDPHQVDVKTKMDALTSYLAKHDYPRDMTRKIKAFFRHFYDNTSTFDDVQMLQQLPYTLYEKAAAFLVQKLIRNFVVFAAIDKNVVALILKVLKPISVSADVIVKIGHPADTMYLINKGVVNITGRKGQIQAQFRAGQSFMEYAAFRMLRKHEFNAVAVSQVDLYALHADDLETIAEDQSKVRGETSAFEAIALLRQNVILLEQFRAYAGCSLVGLDAQADHFEDAVVAMMLGRDNNMMSPAGGYEWRAHLKKTGTKLNRRKSRKVSPPELLGMSTNRGASGTISEGNDIMRFESFGSPGPRAIRQRASFRRPSMHSGAGGMMQMRRGQDDAMMSTLLAIRSELGGVVKRMGALESRLPA